MPELAEIVLRCRGNRRLLAGFDGWSIEERGALVLLSRADATTSEVHEALAEIADLGLELESFHRLEMA